MHKTHQRETKLFEFSRDMNKKELGMRKKKIILQCLYFARARLYIAMTV